MIMMRRCSVSPYEGNDDFIFASYCHKDSHLVYPIIESMAKDGYRIWYDEGIDPGTDWPEIIAEHLNKCTVCISFITENSVDSHNCRREINYALLKKKPFISVLLERIQLSAGMEMQLSTVQSVLRYKHDSFGDFLQKIYQGKDMDSCKGDATIAIVPENSEDSQNRFYIIRQNNGEIITIKGTEFKIGRKEELCDYAVANNKTISRVHAILSVDNDTLFIRDNNSMNKVFINGNSIPPTQKVALRDGDEFRLGSEHFSVTIEKR